MYKQAVAKPGEGREGLLSPAKISEGAVGLFLALQNIDNPRKITLVLARVPE